MADENTFELEIDIATATGAAAVPSTQCITLYIPDRDKHGKEIGNQRHWVLAAADLLAEVGGGFTIEPASEGGWLDPDTKTIVWDKTVQIYSYIKPENFVPFLPKLRGFLHRLGRETNQGEIAFEFDGRFYRLWNFES
jgi:hypothetical protein